MTGPVPSPAVGRPAPVVPSAASALSGRPGWPHPTAVPRAALVGAATTVAVAAALDMLARRRRGGPSPSARWTRTNHAGRPVSLLEGPAVVLGAVVATLVPGATAAWPVAFATAAAGALGALDDHLGDGSTTPVGQHGSAATSEKAPSKGLRGHLAALRRGRVTTGAVKVVGLVVGGGVAAYGVRRAARTAAGPGGLEATRSRRGAGGTSYGGMGSGGSEPGGRGVDAALLAVDAGVVAGTANLVNLLDLRPGRALKATILLAAPMAGWGSVPAGAAVGAAVAALPDDLAGRSMLGDTGANALGALVGTAAVARLPAWARVGALGALTVLTLASERVSFTAVIARTPVLRELDAWGRR